MLNTAERSPGSAPSALNAHVPPNISTIWSTVTCSRQIFMYRNDYLAYTLKGRDSMIKTMLKLPHRADIVIFSAGAHFHDLGDLQYIWSILHTQLIDYHRQYPQVKLVWKSQNPGHLQCKQYTVPLLNHSTYLEETKSVEDKYQWNLHPIFDNYMETQLSYPNASFIQYLDMSPLYLRPDAHGDCLHFCLPGPLDLLSILLLNQLETMEL
jgi:hypothetical protein